MRHALPIALAACLTPGAAPPQGSPAAECRLSYPEALTALRRLPVRDRSRQASEDAYTHTRHFDPRRVVVFGTRVERFSATEVNAISHQSLTLVTHPDAPYEWVRATALGSRDRNACTNREGPLGYCEIDERHDGDWTITLILEAEAGRPVLTCTYTRPSA